MLPAKIRVKLLSEAAGYVSVSRVAQRDFSVAELLEVLLPVVGGDTARIRQILQAGTVVSGEYRFRWESLVLEDHELGPLLDSLPRAEPSRPFQPENGFALRFRRGQETFDLRRETASRKPLFARNSFWDALVEAFGGRAAYADYAHAEKADIFAVEIGAEEKKTLESLLPLARPKGVAERIERLQPERIEWLVRR
jgi:hypothetical protein